MKLTLHNNITIRVLLFSDCISILRRTRRCAPHLYFDFAQYLIEIPSLPRDSGLSLYYGLFCVFIKKVGL